MTTLDGQTAIVTGASKGIGKAVAKRFAREGANVVTNSRSLERARATAEEIEDEMDAGSALGLAADVSECGEVEQLVEETVGELGPVDILVGNAGIHDDSISLDEVPADQLDSSFDELFGVNVKGI